MVPLQKSFHKSRPDALRCTGHDDCLGLVPHKATPLHQLPDLTRLQAQLSKLSCEVRSFAATCLCSQRHLLDARYPGFVATVALGRNALTLESMMIRTSHQDLALRAKNSTESTEF